MIWLLPLPVRSAVGYHLSLLIMYDDFQAIDRWTGKPVHCRYQALIVAIATRHADAVDIKFLVEERPVWIALPHRRVGGVQPSDGQSHHRSNGRPDRRPLFEVGNRIRRRQRSRDVQPDGPGNARSAYRPSWTKPTNLSPADLSWAGLDLFSLRRVSVKLRERILVSARAFVACLFRIH